MSDGRRARVWVSQPLFDDVVAQLGEHFELTTTQRVSAYSPAELAAQLAPLDGALITLNERIGAAEIAAAPQLRAIANVGVGYNNLDLDALSAAGILASNTPDVLTETTADLGFALLMATARRITESERWLRDGQWGQWSFKTMLGADIHGSTLGILGMGRIGQGIARRGAHGFGMRVLYHTAASCRPLPNRRWAHGTWISTPYWRSPIIWCWCCHTPRTRTTSSTRRRWARCAPPPHW
ncbi:NAD(P)-dependent oxidoreductase [Xanthomonas axonopodis]